jgi:hypothetical protein
MPSLQGFQGSAKMVRGVDLCTEAGSTLLRPNLQRCQQWENCNSLFFNESSIAHSLRKCDKRYMAWAVSASRQVLFTNLSTEFVGKPKTLSGHVITREKRGQVEIHVASA